MTNETEIVEPVVVELSFSAHDNVTAWCRYIEFKIDGEEYTGKLYYDEYDGYDFLLSTGDADKWSYLLCEEYVTNEQLDNLSYDWQEASKP